MVLIASEVHAIHRSTPFLVNLSNEPGGNSTNPGPSRQEPTRDPFESTSDLKHNGSSGRQIYYYSLSPAGNDSRTLNQITHFAGDSSNPTANVLGNVMAFDSAADILGTGSTARQIFLWYRDTGIFVQLTRGTADSMRPHIDLKGETVVFESQADLKGNGTGGIGTQIFFYDISGQRPLCDISGCHPNAKSLVQVTYQAGQSTRPFITEQNGPDDGRYILFQSDAAIVGPSNGFQQIYLYDRGDGGRITQITNGAGDSTFPGADSTAEVIAFQSEADLLGTGSVGSQVFLLDRTKGILKQITRTGSNSMEPSLSGLGSLLSFVSTGDLLGTGASGQHLFFYDPRTLHMFQVTKHAGSLTDHPKSAGEFFILFDTDEDVMNTGMSGRQVYSLNVFGRIPNSVIAKRSVPLSPQGQIQLLFGERDDHSEATITVPSSAVKLPPIPVPGFGTFCITATANGSGFLDCAGGRAGGNIVLTRDHYTNDVDPTCAVDGSCEEGRTCPGPLPHPHISACPVCIAGICNNGPNTGQPCATDAGCVQNVKCVPGGTCNGPVRTEHSGVYRAGGVQVGFPVDVGLSLDAGKDGFFCTTDDEWVFKNLPTELELTTGSATGAILDANDVIGNTMTVNDAGAGFDCWRLEQGNFEGAALVGVLPLLDIPTAAPGFSDVIVPVHLPALGGKPYVECDTLACKVLTVCLTNVDCSDGNVCNGVEACINNTCVPGTPPTCDDGDPCNGAETCHPVLGCQPGTALNCDDGAACTQDACVAGVGCTHSSIPGCCVADADCIDTNLCNGSEICASGNCISGAPMPCDDGNVCNGSETCDPTGGCQPGTAPDRFSYDGVRCAIDSIQAALDATPDQLLGGHSRVARYNRLLVSVRANFAYLVPNPRRTPLGTKLYSKIALGRLNLLSQALASSIRTGRAYPAYATPIKDLVAEAMLRLRHFRISAPQPSSVPPAD